MTTKLPAVDPAQSYRGYLSGYVEQIREMAAAGATTRAIAEEIYRHGARAGTTDLNTRMRRAHHIANLRPMVLHILQRLGLRTRRKRAPRWPSVPSASANHDCF
jgi:hypothetical protein